MKKLISVFAAMALVGSIAAAPRKPAAKPAAKPVVATPAVPTAAAAAPMAVSAAKGVGLFIDLRGSYTFSNGTSSALADGTTSADTNATSVTYKSSNSQGFGGGVSIGYDIATGLGLVASYDIRSIKTREWSQYNAAGATVAIQQKWTNQIIGLGFRPHVNALGGEWFAGAGLAVVLPFETTLTNTFSNPTAAFNTATGNRTKTEEVKGYNIAFGAYAELGYKFMFTDMIGLNIGLRAVVATANNIDKTKVVTTSATTTTTATTTYKESYSTDQNTAEAAANTATATKALASYETLGITDFSGNVGISLKF